MDSQDAEPTQQATQTALDPRRVGKQNSGFSDEDLADIICILIPSSSHTRTEAYQIARESSHHLVGGDNPEEVEDGLASLDDDDHQDLDIDSQRGQRKKHAIALRFSARVKDPLQGFTFGRNLHRCDICFVNDPQRRLSNVHFRIYLNEYGSLMLEDRSTNGTIVNEKLLKGNKDTKRMLNNGARIEILSHVGENDLKYLVRIPKREGDYAAAYQRNFREYMNRLEQLREYANATIAPGPRGPVDLFPSETPEFKRPRRPKTGAIAYDLPQEITQDGSDRLSNDWTGSDRYHRVGKIGQGAFATVYKVTDKYDGVPYAAKELDKRKFMKNGVLDQKVENEMNIMQRIQHPNIVGYKDHLDWDDRLLIIIMEYVQGGDLGTLIQKERPLNEEAVRVMAKQLLGALGYLHAQNITHRDVKPDNILISSQQPFVVKLTDFGLSKMVDTEQTFLRTFCGTLLYCAPEVYNEYAEYDEFGHRNPRNRQRRQHGQRYDHAVDIWSLGGVLFYAMTGKPPYPVRNGISYSELLHQIMTKELDVSPLVHAGISRTGIDFIRRMLNRRPEARATVQMLEHHPWLGGGGLPPHVTAAESYDEISDDGLDQQASQLSLDDRQDQRLVNDQMPEVEEYSDENDFLGYESEKENYTFGAFTQLPGTQLYDGRPGSRNPPRLFGEVNVSAIGSSGVMPERLNLPSSGVIPENRFKLPGSNASLATTDIQGEYEVKDSFDSEDTPKGKQQRSQPDSGPGLRVSVLSTSQSRSVNDLNNMTFDVESQDLGGAESIMENLNMRSLAASHFPSHDSNYFTTSKRKTSYEASDGSQTSASHDRPVIKRFKSEALIDSMTDYSSDDDGEFDLLAHVPPVARTRSSRQMDEPVNKSTYWTAGDRKSYHLRYPEMTQFQLDAFHSAAAARGEEFGPGKTPLWDLAMKYFPPTHYEQVVSRTPLDIETVSNASNDVAKPPRPSKLRDELLAPPDDIPPTAQQGGDADDIPDTLVPHDHNIIVPIPSNPPGKRIVASLQSTPESGIQGISIHVTESMLSWGRGAENTRIYEASKEIKIPKYAFKLMLWKSGYDPSKDFRPWNQNLSAEEEDAFHFYVSTKSTRGIFVNDVPLPSHDCKNLSSPSRHWMVLHDQDRIAVWKDPVDKSSRTEVIFRCAWGGSSRPRPPSAGLPALVPEVTARRLDDLCARAERRVRHNDEHDFKIAEAEIDRNERAAEIGRERERSRVFELRRVEACRALAAKGAGGGSRRGSPASVGPRGSPAPGPLGAGGRAVPVRGGRRSPGVDG